MKSVYFSSYEQFFFTLPPVHCSFLQHICFFAQEIFFSALLWSWQAHWRIGRLWLACCTIKYIVHVFLDAVLASVQYSIRVIFREQRPLKLKVLWQNRWLYILLTSDSELSVAFYFALCERSPYICNCLLDIASGLASGYLECKIRLIPRVDKVHFSSRFTVTQTNRTFI